MLQVSVVIPALAGNVRTVAVVVGLYVPQDPPEMSNAGVVLYAVGKV